MLGYIKLGLVELNDWIDGVRLGLVNLALGYIVSGWIVLAC